MIQKIHIQNFKCFKGAFTVELNRGLNILVGDNEAGKSTILQAVHLALTGVYNKHYLRNELSQYVFNIEVLNEYISKVKTTPSTPLPEITIEIFYDDSVSEEFEGSYNHTHEKARGISCKIAFDESYRSEYDKLDKSTLKSLPIEYYEVVVKTFARQKVTSYNIPEKSVLIDSSTNSYKNGSDIFLSRVLRGQLDSTKTSALSQSIRQVKDVLNEEAIIKEISNELDAQYSRKKVSVSVDLSTKNAWETMLTTYCDEVPFENIGKGEQCMIKTLLALSKNQSKNVILLEEPEAHLSHSKLNEYITSIENMVDGSQLILTTHSSFVANKLGLSKLILLNKEEGTQRHHTATLTEELNDDLQKTFAYFKKIPGFDTLRMLLTKGAILVEGDSDELIVQKAYMSLHNGKLPIHDGIDIITVRGLAFKRYLEIARRLKLKVAVVTDNDGDFQKKITEKYASYSACNSIKICADNRNNLKTLEPQMADVNKKEDKLRNLFGVNNDNELVTKMTSGKTEAALTIFESSVEFKYPEYIIEAINWVK